MNIRDYIFYRAYNYEIKKKRSPEWASDTATYSVLSYELLLLEILFFVIEGTIGFDMKPITLFYIINKKVIYFSLLIVGSIWLYYKTTKKYKKLKSGWLEELKAKYHQEKYRIPTLCIGLFPFVMYLVVPIIYGTIKGTLRITDIKSGEMLWSISQ